MPKLFQKKIKIITYKYYKKNMKRTTEEYAHEKDSEKDEKIYDWIKNSKNQELKQKFVKFRVTEWINLIEANFKIELIADDNKSYQGITNFLLKSDLFKDFNFQEENYVYDLIKYFPDLKKIALNEKIDIRPDFIIKDIPKDNFIELINKNSFMFRHDKDLNSRLENINYINVIGEIKYDTKLSNSRNRNQRDNYIYLCNSINEINKKLNKNVFYLTLYIYDNSFQKFWLKEFLYENPLIIGYIPCIYNKEFIDNYNKLYKEYNEKNESQQPSIKENNLNIKKPNEIFNKDLQNISNKNRNDTSNNDNKVINNQTYNEKINEVNSDMINSENNNGMENIDEFNDNQTDKNEENSKIIKQNNNEIKNINTLRNENENNSEEIELEEIKNKIISLKKSKSKKVNSYKDLSSKLLNEIYKVNDKKKDLYNLTNEINIIDDAIWSETNKLQIKRNILNLENNNSNLSIENNFQNDLFSKDNGLEFNQSNNINYLNRKTKNDTKLDDMFH